MTKIGFGIFKNSRTFPFLVPLMWKSDTENELTLGNSQMTPPPLLSVVWLVCGRLTLWAGSQNVVPRLRVPAPVSTTAQALQFDGIVTFHVGCVHNPRWQKWAVFQISVAGWQLLAFYSAFPQLFHMASYRRWILLKKRIFFLNVYQSVKKIYNLRTSFSSETRIQVHRANAEDGFVMSEVTPPAPWGESF